MRTFIRKIRMKLLQRMNDFFTEVNILKVVIIFFIIMFLIGCVQIGFLIFDEKNIKTNREDFILSFYTIIIGVTAASSYWGNYNAVRIKNELRNTLHQATSDNAYLRNEIFRERQESTRIAALYSGAHILSFHTLMRYSPQSRILLGYCTLRNLNIRSIDYNTPIDQVLKNKLVFQIYKDECFLKMDHLLKLPPHLNERVLQNLNYSKVNYGIKKEMIGETRYAR